MTGEVPDPVAEKYRQLLYVLNWLEKSSDEKIEVFGESEDGLLPMRFVGRNASIGFDKEKRRWFGVEITTGDDL